MICSLALLAGCGGDDPAQTPAPAAQPAPPSATAATTTATPSADGPASKTKWIGDIPYDVFYNQPLVIASDSKTVPASAVASTTPAIVTPKMSPPSTTSPTSKSPNSTAARSSGVTDWKQLADADVLNDEVKRLRNTLTANLNTVATYNRSIKPIATDGATLAALAAVLEVHPDAVSWQGNAKYIRDLGYDVYTKADGTGRGPFDATKEPFENIIAMLNGGPPPDIDAQDKVPFADIADRGALMLRIKQSFEFLKSEINTEARFKESSDDIIREAGVMASFGGMIATDSYDSADEDLYKQFVRDFIQANVDVRASVREGDFTKFDDARSRIQNSCAACHGEYSFGDDGL